MGLGTMTIAGATMAQVAGTLSGILDRLVIDRTGLDGAFDATLRWTPDQSTPELALKANLAGADPNGPSIFTAMQEQLGLKLEPTRSPIEMLVITGAEPPTPD
jgi:uncharacterized protein (TIGR03435 family)